MTTKIAIDASNIRLGGGVTHLVGIINSLGDIDAKDLIVCVWCSRETASQLHPRSWLEIRTPPILSKGLLWRTFWQQIRLPKDLEKVKADILFAPGGIGPLFSKVPLVTLSQNMLPFQEKEMARYGKISWMYWRLQLVGLAQRISMAKAVGRIYLTDFARTTIEKIIKTRQGQVKVIPHGLGGEFLCSPRPQRAIGELTWSEPLRILYVSIVDVYKHQWKVAEAVKELIELGVPLAVDFVGPGYPAAVRRLELFFRRSCSVKVKNFVKYVGPVPFEYLPRLYSQYDLFVFASSCENFPNILLEAMSSGLPVACSDIESIREVMADCAVYFDPTDSRSIRSAVLKMIKDKALREELANAGFERSLQFRWERTALQTFSFIKSLIRSNLEPGTR